MNLKSMLLDEFEYYGKPTTDSQLTKWVEELSDLNIFDVKLALASLRKDPERIFPALPGKIRDEIYNYPSLEEAWAMCPKNESDSVVWCDEISQAYASARSLIAINEFISARMAFKDVYEKAVAKAKAEKRKPKWWPSFGEDKETREPALMLAVEKNRIDVQKARSYMPEFSLPEPKNKTLQLTTRLSDVEIDERQRLHNLAKVQEILEMLNKKSGGKK